MARDCFRDVITGGRRFRSVRFNYACRSSIGGMVMSYFKFFGELYDGVMVEEVVSNDDFYGACQRWSADCDIVYRDWIEFDEDL